MAATVCRERENDSDFPVFIRFSMIDSEKTTLRDRPTGRDIRMSGAILKTTDFSTIYTEMLAEIISRFEEHYNTIL